MSERKRAALLMGILYRGTDSELSGCINDVENTGEQLEEHFGYDDFTILTDDSDIKPTKKNIYHHLLKMADRTVTEELDEVFIHYSGHGSYVEDFSGDEKDGFDECLVPLDHDKFSGHEGLITDDLLNNVLGSFRKETNVFFLIDMCHSGTSLDARYKYIAGRRSNNENKKCRIKCNLMMFSGCKDPEYSHDAWNVGNSKKWSGAMTSNFWDVCAEHGYDINCWEALRLIRKRLVKQKFPQVPQICCTRKLDRSSKMFQNVYKKGFITNASINLVKEKSTDAKVVEEKGVVKNNEKLEK